MAQVFISFAPEDRAWVRHLADALTGAGFEVFWDIAPGLGRAMSVDVDAELAKASAVVAVWSAASRASNWVRDVAQEAQERGSLLPVLKDIDRPPLGFRQLRCADLRGWPDGGANADALTELIAQLRERIPQAAATDVDLERSTIILHDRPSDPSASFAARTAGTPTATEGTARSLPRTPARIGGAGDLRPGDEVGQYRVVRRLGAGGFGAVYEAANIHNEDERVALKLLLTDIASSERFAQLLKLEANALLRLKHPAVVQYRVFGRIADSEQFYLVTEFIPGPTLRDWRRENAPTMAQLRTLAVRLAQGLSAAHRRGIVHRDLAPDNVIVAGGEIGEATLIDFGIARMGDSDALGGAFAGKFSYAAPEQFDFDGERLGPAIDIYSFGLLLAAFVRGRPLDMGRDIDAAREHRRSVPPLDVFPNVLREPLNALLQPNPQDRPRNMDEVARLFEHVPDTDEIIQLLPVNDTLSAASAPDSETTRTSLALAAAEPDDATEIAADATIVQPAELAEAASEPAAQPGLTEVPAEDSISAPEPLAVQSDADDGQVGEPSDADVAVEDIRPRAAETALDGSTPPRLLPDGTKLPDETPPRVASAPTPPVASATQPLKPPSRRSRVGAYAAAAVVLLIAAAGAVVWWPAGHEPQVAAGDPNASPVPETPAPPPTEPVALPTGTPASPVPSAEPASPPPETPSQPAPSVPHPEPAPPPAPTPQPPVPTPSVPEPSAEPAAPPPSESEPPPVDPDAGPGVPVPAPKPDIPAEPVPTPEPEPQAPPQPAPQPVPQPPAPEPPPATTTGNELDQALQALSAIRTAAGVRAVTVDRNLVRVALALAQNDATANAYVPPSGSAVLNLLIKSGYGNARATQNHARRQKSVQAVFQTWRQQASVAQNLVDPGVVAMGFAGAVAADGTPYWVLILAYPP
ncbi:MAG: protein kinase [Alphaproteobacteria bacterium]|nr:protein kinase [Alphaproteobacteria bacterium]